ncbi:polyprenol phosphomannose-dependent alpha 1,6 mannosyltransferase MptB [Cryptosporangium sp. NPDC051539]|uniref:polyprenol phosphomannose-dependent alpha 1,6 mannosyltransferase MptB n=1 Tax=Cryptosporangium sp. NPDC051539 TaxID=3363962 RepID=UPI00379D1C2C
MQSPSVAPAVLLPGHGRSVRWLGFAGSVLVAIGGLGAGVLPRPDPLWDAPVLRDLRHGSGPPVCITLAAIGMALLVYAWWRLRTASSPGAVTRTAALWALPLMFGPPMFSRDLYSYAAQGLVLARGLDPYRFGPSEIPSGLGADWVTSVSSTWVSTPAPYGPLYLYLASRVAGVSGDNLIVALLALRLLAVVGLIALALIVPRTAVAFGGDPARAQWLVIANPLLLAHLVAGGHNEAIMLPFLAAAFWVATLATGPVRRVLGIAAAAGALVGLAAAVKVSAVVALPFVVVLVAAAPAWGAGSWNRLIRAATLVSVVAVAVFGLVSALAGLGLGWVHALAVTNGVSVQWTSIPTGWGLAAGWFTSADDAVLAVARALGTLLTAVVLVVLWWRVRTAPAQRVAGACAAALFVLAVLGESFHPWYLLWALAPLAAAAGSRIATAMAVLSGVLSFFVLPDGYNVARATSVPGTIFDLLLTAGAVYWAVRFVRRRREVLDEHA